VGNSGIPAMIVPPRCCGGSHRNERTDRVGALVTLGCRRIEAIAVYNRGMILHVVALDDWLSAPKDVAPAASNSPTATSASAAPNTNAGSPPWYLENNQVRRQEKKDLQCPMEGRQARVQGAIQDIALTDSFRSELLVAAKKGEPFNTTTGRSLSALKADNTTDWFTFASEYAAIKWPGASPEHQRGIAEALTNITAALLTTRQNKPDNKALRTACKRAFNLNTRDSPVNDETAAATRWLERNTRPEVLASPLAKDPTTSATPPSQHGSRQVLR
jgi:hypothetical protein